MIVDFNFDGPSHHYYPSKVHAERDMGAVFGEYDKHSHCEYQYQVVPPAPARSGVRKGIVSGQRCLNLSMIHTIAFTFALAAAEVCGANHMVDEFVLDSIQPGGAGKSQT
jgi:hypothetical protein